jgi:hypothetical protein
LDKEIDLQMVKVDDLFNENPFFSHISEDVLATLEQTTDTAVSNNLYPSSAAMVADGHELPGTLTSAELQLKLGGLATAGPQRIERIRNFESGKRALSRLGQLLPVGNSFHGINHQEMLDGLVPLEDKYTRFYAQRLMFIRDNLKKLPEGKASLSFLVDFLLYVQANGIGIRERNRMFEEHLSKPQT